MPPFLTEWLYGMALGLIDSSHFCNTIGPITDVQATHLDLFGETEGFQTPRALAKVTDGSSPN